MITGEQGRHADILIRICTYQISETAIRVCSDLLDLFGPSGPMTVRLTHQKWYGLNALCCIVLINVTLFFKELRISLEAYSTGRPTSGPFSQLHQSDCIAKFLINLKHTDNELPLWQLHLLRLYGLGAYWYLWLQPPIAAIALHLHVSLDRMDLVSFSELRFLDRDDEIVLVAGSDIDAERPADTAQSQHLVHLSRQLRDYPRFIHHGANTMSTDSASPAALSDAGSPVVAPVGSGRLSKTDSQGKSPSVLCDPFVVSIFYTWI